MKKKKKKMELVRVKSGPAQGRLVRTSRVVPSDEQNARNANSTHSLLRSLHQDNLLIRRKLKEIETRLERVSFNDNNNNSQQLVINPEFDNNNMSTSTMTMTASPSRPRLDSASFNLAESTSPARKLTKMKRPKTAGPVRARPFVPPHPVLALPEPTAASNLLDQIRERYIATNGGLIVDSRPKRRNISSASSSLNFDRIIDNLNQYIYIFLI